MKEQRFAPNPDDSPPRDFLPRPPQFCPRTPALFTSDPQKKRYYRFRLRVRCVLRDFAPSQLCSVPSAHVTRKADSKLAFEWNVFCCFFGLTFAANELDARAPAPRASRSTAHVGRRSSTSRSVPTALSISPFNTLKGGTRLTQFNNKSYQNT
jgi:hypothetical protein